MKQPDVWIFYSGRAYQRKSETGYIDKLINKAKNEYNIILEVKNAHRFIISSGESNELYYEGKKVEILPKYAIFRRYDIYLARQLESLGVKVFNSVQSMVDARNKMKIHQILAQNKISTPKTLFINSKKNLSNITYKEVCDMLNTNKFVIKWIYGCQGTHVFLVDNEEYFNELIHNYKGKVLFQEYIESSFGKDIRAYVIGHKYICAAIRKSESDFRSNLAKGGQAYKFDYNKEIENLAVNAAKVTNLDICGVDILIGNDNKYYICEVNSVPGFKSVKRTSNINEMNLFLTLIKDKMNEEK
jgi:ribosomal protein S6--L-glutamate ligase/gamma-F420-2:alpha-L-glutamate ligase